MARTNNNKYASINFNHIYDKNLTNNNSPIPSKHPSASSSSASSPVRAHGRMLVLTRPASKPVSSSIATPPLSPSPRILPTHQPLDHKPESDAISLRPLGRTGGGVSSSIVQVPEVVAVGSPKSDKFVPPHLRPGFVGKEERPGPDLFRQQQQQQQQQKQGYFGSPGLYGENGRPKSGGYERRRSGGESDLGLMNRPTGSNGTRPSSSGCCGNRELLSHKHMAC